MNMNMNPNSELVQSAVNVPNLVQVPDALISQAREFQQAMMMYTCAIREVKTKLEVLNDELSIKNQRNPIEMIKSRVKKPISIVEKLQRRNLPVTLESMMNNLDDVAGIRVICSFVDDIYAVANMLVSQDDITVIAIKDYIKNPKPNGDIMTGDLIPANVLATHTIANVSETLAEKLGLPRQYRSIGIITADSDDVTYCALDEATKAAAVEVVYGRSLYAGAGNASTKLAGEVIGILAGPNPAEVQSGLRACAEFMASGVGFRSANEDGSIVYFAHTVSRTGTYLSKTAGVREGEALAYLIAPPLEAVVGLDEALKASDVELAALFEPPSETNFGGGLLTGTQSACNAACAAFAEAVKAVAARPREI